jgi:dTDP-4-dehydrorhamnose 3,5-epimerase-like enzyme
MRKQPSVSDIQVVEKKGPWTSKSGGKLEVHFALPKDVLERFLDFDNPAFDEVPEDIRGLRSYTVSNIPKGSVGGKEWHKARTEYISAIAGAAVIDCVDLGGNEKEYTLDGNSAIIIPPGILHTYEALEDGTTLQVIANTLFVPDNPETHDTYPVDSFS